MDETNPAANVCMVFAVLSTVALSFKRKKIVLIFISLKKIFSGQKCQVLNRAMGLYSN